MIFLKASGKKHEGMYFPDNHGVGDEKYAQE